jgi:hypothetical protein
MTWLIRLFRRADPLPDTFARALALHIDAVTHDGVGKWYRKKPEPKDKWGFMSHASERGKA